MTFEARSKSADVWKKLVDSMKELVQEVNVQCTPLGLSIQSMDPAHVALVCMSMKKEGFDMFHNERNLALGINLTNFSKVLKTMDSKDKLTLRHNVEDSTLTIIGEQVKDAETGAAGPRVSEYSLKLMEIDADSMGVPDIEYQSEITMSASEFSKICKDMAVFGDTITVGINREGVYFKNDGDIGTGNVKYNCDVQVTKGGAAAGMHGSVKQEIKPEVKLEDDGTGDFDGDLDAPFVPKPNPDAASEAASMTACMSEPVELSFALRYFTTFSKGASLADKVKLSLTLESPCQIEFMVENTGFLRYYLAPKVEAAE